MSNVSVAAGVLLVWAWYAGSGVAVACVVGVHSLWVAWCLTRGGEKWLASLELLPVGAGVAVLLESEPRYTALSGPAGALLYAYGLARICVVWFRSPPTQPRAHERVHAIRLAAVQSAMYAGAIVMLYYVRTATALIDGTSVTLSQSTIVNNSTQCDQDTSQEKFATTLYDESTFVLECAWDVWRRSRINVLALLQVWLVYSLLFRPPYLRENVSQDRQNRYLVASLLQSMLLFAGVTFWVDSIFEWYMMPQSSAVLLTLAAACELWLLSYVHQPRQCQFYVFISE